VHATGAGAGLGSAAQPKRPSATTKSDARIGFKDFSVRFE
jgi:hypothetical protein